MEPLYSRHSRIHALSTAGFTSWEKICRFFSATSDNLATQRVTAIRRFSPTGFTLIEMVVVLGIIGAVTGLALSSQSSFNKTLILANTAYDVALTLRSAQSFGLSSRALGSAANAGYGLHFQRGTANSFLMFADIWPPTDLSCTRPDCKPGDHLYQVTDKIVQTYALGNGLTVSNFCAHPALQPWQCASTGELISLDITFARPNPDAFITTNGSLFFTSYVEACITLSAPTGESRFVSVGASGEIVATATACPSS